MEEREAPDVINVGAAQEVEVLRVFYAVSEQQ